MPYRRSPRAKTDKHELSWSNLGQDASPGVTVALVRGVPPASKDEAVPSECITGNHVNGIYMEFHFSAAQTGSVNVIHWVVEVVRAGQTMPIPSLYYQNERAQIIKRGMEMLPVNVSTVFKRIHVASIPKIYQRIRDDTRINFRYIASATQTINACGIAIYKENT